MKILFVCLGNICRSPLAEGILVHKVREKGLDWQIDSAGTGHWHVGSKPDSRSIDVANKNGVDITYQRARQFTVEDFKKYDLILVMDSSNYRDVMRMAGTDEDREKVELIMNFVYPDQNRAVPDPYWDDDGFDQVYRMLDLAADAIIEKYAQTN